MVDDELKKLFDFARNEKTPFLIIVQVLAEQLAPSLRRRHGCTLLISKATN